MVGPAGKEVPQSLNKSPVTFMNDSDEMYINKMGLFMLPSTGNRLNNTMWFKVYRNILSARFS